MRLSRGIGHALALGATGVAGIDPKGLNANLPPDAAGQPHGIEVVAK